MTGNPLFQPLKLGALNLKHRIVLAPLTRLRAEAGHVPSEIAAEYYAQRATEGGLLISEATLIAPEAGGTPGAPGLWSSEQIEAWKKIKRAVHDKGGYIFAQLWALGRVAKPENVAHVKGPSEDTYNGNRVTALSEAEIDSYVDKFAQAAKNAIAAGFDGCEIHGANGYLVDQFLQTVTNRRTDTYGGSLANRFRFPLRVLDAVAGAIGPERTGIRLSPFSRYQGMREAQPLDTFVLWVQAIVAHQPGLAYIHGIEARIDDEEHVDDSLAPLREVTGGVPLIAAGGYTPELALEHAAKTNDLIAFGRWFISNPDLPSRVLHQWDMNKYDRSTFYAGGSKGYIDYPTHVAAAKA